MTDPDFWNLIDVIDVAALDKGHEDEALDPLRTELALKSEQDILAFEECLSRKLYDLDGEVFADHAGDSSGSDDAFLYVRCYVVAKGRAFYDAVKSDAALMPQSLDQWCEPLLYVAQEAWTEQTGKDPSEWTFEASVSYETGSNTALWPD